VVSHGHPLLPETVMGVGIKGDQPLIDLASMPRTRAWIEGWGAGRPVALGPYRLRVQDLWKMTIRQSIRGVRRRGRRALASVTPWRHSGGGG